MPSKVRWASPCSPGPLLSRPAPRAKRTTTVVRIQSGAAAARIWSGATTASSCLSPGSAERNSDGATHGRCPPCFEKWPWWWISASPATTLVVDLERQPRWRLHQLQELPRSAPLLSLHGGTSNWLGGNGGPEHRHSERRRRRQRPICLWWPMVVVTLMDERFRRLLLTEWALR